MTAQRKFLHKEIVCVVFGALFLALGSPAEAQQAKKIHADRCPNCSAPLLGGVSIFYFKLPGDEIVPATVNEPTPLLGPVNAAEPINIPLPVAPTNRPVPSVTA